MIVGVSVNDDGTEVRLIVADHNGEMAVDLKPEYAKKLAGQILVTAYQLGDMPSAYT